MSRLIPLVGLLLLGCFGCWGCRGGSEPAQPAPPTEALPPNTLPTDLPPVQVASETDAAGTASPVAPVAAGAPAQPSDGSEAAEPDAAEPTVVPPRDPSAELQQAVGVPADCIQDYRPSSAMTIEVDVQAVIRPSGLVIEPSATGRGLSANDQRCIEQRVGQVVLTPLPSGLSQNVAFRIAIPYEPEAVEEYDVGGPAPKLKDVVEPLPKKAPIAPSGVPIEGPSGDRIDGPSGVPIEGPQGVPIEGPRPVPIEGY